MWDVRKRVVPTGSIEEEAKRYTEIGVNVIPLQPPRENDPRSGKRPALKSWKEFQERKATEDELQRWFFLTRFNIGIVTGSISRIVVVDCDDDEAVDWCQLKLAETTMITRTGKGYHLFYRHPGETVRNGAKLDGRNLDVRGDGGYVVAPPSMHHTGRKYEKVGNWNVRPPVFNPSWLAITERRVPRMQEAPQDVDRMRYRARKYIERIFSISGEGGDRQLFRAACALIQRFGLTEADALQELILWNQTNAKPAWPIGRLRYKISQALMLKS